jgi:hypothetical protein
MGISMRLSYRSVDLRDWVNKVFLNRPESVVYFLPKLENDENPRKQAADCVVCIHYKFKQNAQTA